MLLCCLAITQGAWAINDVVFTETFDDNSDKGGRDGTFNGTGSKTPAYDNSGWTGNTSNKVYQAYKCIKIGSGSDNGTFANLTVVE